MKTPGISETKRFVFDLAAFKTAVVKIDVKLPQDAETVTGVFFSLVSSGKMQGIISLRFSEGSSNPLLYQLVKTPNKMGQKKVKHIPVHEPVKQGTTITGYYRDTSTLNKNYTLKVYIEYIPRQREKTDAK